MTNDMSKTNPPTSSESLPSEQVAEDEAALSEGLKTEPHPSRCGTQQFTERPCDCAVAERRAALSRLAAKAQGYEAMKAERDAARQMHGALVLSGSEKFAALERERDNARTSETAWRQRLEAAAEALADVMPGECGRLDIVSRVKALKAERDRAKEQLAWSETQRAEALLGRQRMESERDAAVAANAALLQALVTKCEQCNGTGTYLPFCEFCSDSGHGHECPPRRACTHPGVTPVLSLPYPGAALLAEHAKAMEIVALVGQYQHRDEPDVLTTLRRLLEERARIAHMVTPGDHAKALVRARNEGREEAAAWHDAKGDAERVWLDVNERLPNRPTVEAHRSFLECHRSSANAIRARKEPES